MKIVIATAQWVSDNYVAIIALLAIISGLFIKVKKFFSQKKEDQKAQLKEQATEMLQAIQNTLLDKVVEAEKEYGSGTGALKKSKVYTMILAACPKLIDYIEQKLISADVIGAYIDEAVDTMNNMKDNNEKVASIINTAANVIEASNILPEETDGK